MRYFSMGAVCLTAAATVAFVSPIGQAEDATPAGEQAEVKEAAKVSKPIRKVTNAATAVPAKVEIESIEDQATHREALVIQATAKDLEDLQINAFALSSTGEIVAACGNGPGEVRVLSGDGEFLRSWKIDVKPEAINSTTNGEVLVAGSGKLYRYSSKGELLQTSDSPHAVAIKADAEQLREQAIALLDRMSGRGLAAQIPAYERFVKQLEEKKERSKQEETALASIKSRLETMKEQVAAQAAAEEDGKPKFTEEQIQQQVDNMTRSKMRIASISTDGTHVFVATGSLQGRGYDVWKMKPDFSDGKVVVTGLSGCCGQMDVQAGKDGIFVAENSRHRVVRYDADGEQLTTWGKRDRTGLEGFTSCCNPMNVCISRTGDVYTAESSTGRIRRYTADGEFVNFVGDVKLVSGCKNVSIAVSSDNERVYMLDITRNRIVMMKKADG